MKKFITGKGNAKKEVVMKHLYKTWGYDIDSPDESDAACLALMARALWDVTQSITPVQAEALKGCERLPITRHRGRMAAPGPVPGAGQGPALPLILGGSPMGQLTGGSGGPR
jgi:hypothetical protein